MQHHEECNITRFNVLKKQHFQNTWYKHYSTYLEWCIDTKTTPKILSPEVLIINSLLQIEWEEAHFTLYIWP